MKSIEHLSSKNQIIDKIKLIKTFKATWEYDPETKEYKITINRIYKGWSYAKQWTNRSW